jgi:hypothetical protein
MTIADQRLDEDQRLDADAWDVPPQGATLGHHKEGHD